MDDFAAYKLYAAIKLHFTQKSYDVFATRGAVKGLTPDKFRARKESGWFRVLARKFNEPKEFVQFVVACAAYGTTNDVFDLQTSFEHYANWIKNKQKSTRLILDDLDSIDDLTPLITGTPPKIIEWVIAGKLHVETAVAVNRFKPYLSDELFTQDYLIFSREALKIKKLDRFVKYNTDEINLVLTEKIH